LQSWPILKVVLKEPANLPRHARCLCLWPTGRRTLAARVATGTLVTVPAPCRLIKRGKFGISVWAAVLLDKYLRGSRGDPARC